MTLILPKVGLASFLKEGSRHYHGLDESLSRSIQACVGLAATVRSSYGPTGMNKMIVSSLEKLFVTNDAYTILKQLQVEHPAAKLIVMVSEQQQMEVGDGTNAVVVLAASLLENGGELLRMGMPLRSVIKGYKRACEIALKELPNLVVKEVKDVRDRAAVTEVLQWAMGTKQYENAAFLTELVVTACLTVLPKNLMNFNVDRVRVCKVLGASTVQSTVFNGMAFKTTVVTDVKRLENAKIIAFSCPFDIIQTETKGTLSLSTADALLQFAKGEEASIENFVKGLHDMGIRMVVSGGKIGDLYVHFLNKYNMMAVKLGSKFDLRRLAVNVGCGVLTSLRIPKVDDIGSCDEVYVEEVGSELLVFFKQDTMVGKMSTIIVRGSSANVMDNTERAIHSGINNFRILTRDGRLLAGGGAVEFELARLVEKEAALCTEIEQLSMNKFAVALKMLPKQLAENAGMKSISLLPDMHSKHVNGMSTLGFHITPDSKEVVDVTSLGLYDPFMTKNWLIKLATNISDTILMIDQIIMSKPASGPAPRGAGPMDQDDD